MAGSAEDATALALEINSTHYPYDFAVILDPAKFEADFRARLAREAPTVPFRAGVFRVSDFGVPTFSDITPPRWVEGKLVYYAVDLTLNLPYCVEITDPGSAPTYEPMALDPLPPAPAADEPDSWERPSRYAEEDDILALE